MASALVIGPVGNRVMLSAVAGDQGFDVTVDLAVAEQALGQLAVAVIQARAAKAEGAWLDRRGAAKGGGTPGRAGA